jgi:hypothetical protein
MRRHPCHQLLSPEAEHRADRRVESRDPPLARTSDQIIEASLLAQRAVHEVGHLRAFSWREA